MERYYLDVNILGGLSDRQSNIKKVYSVIHGILRVMEVENPSTRNKIGLSFPGYQAGMTQQEATLGKIIRLVTTKDNLYMLQAFEHSNALEALSSYGENEKEGVCLVNGIKPVPDEVVEAIFKRTTYHDKIHKIIKNKSFNDLKKGFDPNHICIPFVTFKSKTSDNFLNIHIKRIISDVRVDGNYTTYGLASKGAKESEELATVPLF